MVEHAAVRGNSSAFTITHRRILSEMAIVLAAGAIFGFVLFSARIGFGVMVGGILAFANYFWQKHSLRAIFDSAFHGRKARFLSLKYAARYLVIGGLVGLIYISGTISIYGVVFGLSSFVIAIVLEAFISIFQRITEG